MKAKKSEAPKMGKIAGVDRLSFDHFVSQPEEFEFYKEWIEKTFSKDEFFYCSDMFCSTADTNGKPVYTFTENRIVYSLSGVIYTTEGPTALFSSEKDDNMLFTFQGTRLYRVGTKILSAKNQVKTEIVKSEYLIKALETALNVIDSFNGKVLNKRVFTAIQEKIDSLNLSNGSQWGKSIYISAGSYNREIMQIRISSPSINYVDSLSLFGGRLEASYSRTDCTKDRTIYARANVEHSPNDRIDSKEWKTALSEYLENEKKVFKDLKKLTPASVERLYIKAKALEQKAKEIQESFHSIPPFLREKFGSFYYVK